VDGIELLAKILHSSLFGEPDSIAARRIAQRAVRSGRTAHRFAERRTQTELIGSPERHDTERAGPLARPSQKAAEGAQAGTVAPRRTI
jgi:hypothetical protein